MVKEDSFANRLRSALTARNMKQVDFCKKVGVGKSSLSQYLSGEYEPRTNRIAIFAYALGVDIYWLMGFDVPMDREPAIPGLRGTQYEGMSKSQVELYLLAELLGRIDSNPKITNDEKNALILEFSQNDAIDLLLTALRDKRAKDNKDGD